MKKAYLTVVAIALLIVGLVPMGEIHAATITYTVEGTGPMQFPGPVPPPEGSPWGPDGYPGDTVELASFTSTLELAPGTYFLKINTLLWTVDYTYAGTETEWDYPDHWSELLFNVDAPRAMHLGSADGDLDQSGFLEVNWDNDYLSLLDGSTTSFFVDGYQIDVTPLAAARDGAVFPPGPPWVQPERDIVARFDITEAAVPEPSSLALASLSALVVGLVGWRRRRQAVAA